MSVRSYFAQPVALAFLLSGAAIGEAAPVVDDITGVSSAEAGISNGVVNMTIGKAHNGSRVVADKPGQAPWTLRGKGFGSNTGTVTLAGRAVPVLSWSDTSIRIDPSGSQINPERPWDWGGMSTTLAITTAKGEQLSKGLNIVPALVSLRVFEQCTWWVAFRRDSLGLTPSPTAYTGYTTITATWVPRAGDQLQWAVGDGKHNGIIDSVGKPTTTNGVTTYPVGISQYNAAGKNEYSTLATTFKFQGSTVLEKPRFNSTNNQALSYYR